MYISKQLLLYRQEDIRHSLRFSEYLEKAKTGIWSLGKKRLCKSMVLQISLDAHWLSCIYGSELWITRVVHMIKSNVFHSLVVDWKKEF